MPPHVNERWKDYLGPGALSSFVVACVVAVVGLGVPVAWRLREVMRTARRQEEGPADAILVMGRVLDGDLPSPVFQARLDHGAALWRQGLAPTMVVTGGLTGRATRSEAAAGKEYLERIGVEPAAIECEDRSRHTLENLYNVRETVRERGWEQLLVVSDPLHLARVSALGRGLGLRFLCAPAREAAPSGIAWWLRGVREAFFIHWYHCGVVYSRLIGSERNLSRVS